MLIRLPHHRRRLRETLGGRRAFVKWAGRLGYWVEDFCEMRSSLLWVVVDVGRYDNSLLTNQQGSRTTPGPRTTRTWSQSGQARLLSHCFKLYGGTKVKVVAEQSFCLSRGVSERNPGQLVHLRHPPPVPLASAAEVNPPPRERLFGQERKLSI